MQMPVLQLLQLALSNSGDDVHALTGTFRVIGQQINYHALTIANLLNPSGGTFGRMPMLVPDKLGSLASQGRLLPLARSLGG